jgi:hypothetical protein
MSRIQVQTPQSPTPVDHQLPHQRPFPHGEKVTLGEFWPDALVLIWLVFALGFIVYLVSGI